MLLGIAAVLLEQRLVVEDADRLTELRDAPQVALAVRLAVGRPAELLRRAGRELLVPAVLRGVAVERLDQLGLDERRVDLEALVALGDVGRVAAVEGELDDLDVAREAVELQLDLDVRVLLREGRGQRLDDGLGPGILVVGRPHVERDVAVVRERVARRRPSSSWPPSCPSRRLRSRRLPRAPRGRRRRAGVLFHGSPCCSLLVRGQGLSRRVYAERAGWPARRRLGRTGEAPRG